MRVGLPTLLVGLLSACGGGNVPILMYHSVSAHGDVLTVTPAQFDAHLAYLEAAGFSTVSLGQVLDAEDGRATLPAHPVVLTFDDGFQDVATTVLPLLAKRGQKATFFIISGFMGKDAAHRQHDGIGREYLTEPEVVALRDAGMEIGSHTVRHPYLTRLSPRAVRTELETSKHSLEQLLGQRVDLFAYPFTAHQRSVRAAVVHAGYRAAVVGPRGTSDPYELQRYTINRGTTVARLRDLLGESWAQDALGAP